MSSQWPLVAGWLAAKLPTLPGWGAVQVFDGLPSSGDNPSLYATVAYVPDGQGVGTFSKTRADDGFRWIEQGDVRNQLVSTGGDADIEPYSVDVFTLADALEAEIRSNRTLDGTLSTDSNVDLTVEVVEVQNSRGTAATLVLTLSYYTVT